MRSRGDVEAPSVEIGVGREVAVVVTAVGVRRCDYQEAYAF